MFVRRLSVSVAIVLACPVAGVNAADTGATACRTTVECAAMATQAGTSISSAFLPATSQQDQREDRFYWVSQINKASAVMLVEEGIVTPALGTRIAEGVAFSIEQADTPDGKRPSDVLQIERIITERAGPEASRIHTGRSRQDIHATFNAAKLRTQVLDYATALNQTRARLLAMAGQHVHTLVPAYTNGVQAMPISYAHYLLAYAASFERDGKRLREGYARLNLSAMGTAVLSNSSWPLNRQRMADLLGFDGLVENALDAGQVTPYDVPLEVVNLVASTAIRVGAVIGDIHTQYHQTRPWMLLDEGATYTSSAMPQKRNPGILMRVRETSSDVVGLAHTVALRAHNVTTGMTDYKAAWQSLGVLPAAVDMHKDFDRVLDALRIDVRRAQEELDADWTTSMELADILQRTDDVPFRVGHGYASAIVTHASAHSLGPKDFPYEVAVKLFAEVATQYRLKQTQLPLSEPQFRAALSPRAMVDNRVGTGGPQSAEVERMLAEAKRKLAADESWVKDSRRKIGDARVKLDAAFERLSGVEKRK